MAARRASSPTRPVSRRVRVVLFVDPLSGEAVPEDARVRDRRGRYARPERVVRYAERPVDESEARARQYAAQAVRARVRREYEPEPEEERREEERREEERREARRQRRRELAAARREEERREEERREARRQRRRELAAARREAKRREEERRERERRAPRVEPAPVEAEPPVETGPAPRVEHPKRPERIRGADGRFAKAEVIEARSGALADRWREFFKGNLREISERLAIEGYAANIRTVINSDNSVDAQVTVSLPPGEDPRLVLSLLESMRQKNLWPENAPGAFISVGVGASDKRSDSAALKRGRGLPAWSHPVSASRANEAFLIARGAQLKDKPIGIVPSIESHMTKHGRFESVSVRLHWSPVGEKPDRPTARQP